VRVSTVGALCLSLCVPSLASAEDVTAALPGAVVPVGPEGTTVLEVTRSQVGRERFAVVRARAPEQPSRCGAAPERVSAWGQLDGRWTEMAHELVDRCLPGPAVNGRRVDGAVRARIVEIVEGAVRRAELHVRVIDPRRPLDMTSLVRHHRVGDRFAALRVTEPLAATPGLAPRRALAAVADARVDGRLAEWTDAAPALASEHGSLWMAQQGDRLLVAGDVAAAEAPTLTLHLAEATAGTARLRGADGNRGRVVRLSCDGSDPAVRCLRVGDRWHLEGSVDLTAQLYRRRQIDAVSMLAVVDAGGRRVLTTSPDLRLEAVRLAAPIDLLRGASAAVVARCGGGFVGRVSAPGAAADDPLAGALVTCGATCRGGRCEQTVGTGDVGRLEFANGGTCFRGTGPGAADADGCRAGASTRLVGAMQAQGFNAVLGVERAWTADGARWHQAELWTLVTASAEWRRVAVGAAERAGEPALYGSLQMRDGHPALCRGAGGCEVVRELSLQRRVEPTDSVTGDVVASLREAGLIARREP
jgi:hypothetical protein